MEVCFAGSCDVDQQTLDNASQGATRFNRLLKSLRVN